MEIANDNNNSNRIINRGGEVSVIEGPKAINAYRLRCLKLGLKLYLDTGMLPTRGMSGAKLADMIGDVTGKNYKRGRKGQEQALADITAFIDSGTPLEGVEIINS